MGQGGLLAAALAGFFLGAVPFAVLFGLLQRKNLLEEGSGNPGAINAIRVLGWVPGLLVLILEIAKGFFAVAFGEALGGYEGALLAGAAAVWGHAYTPFLLFRGGKGIAPALGVLLAVNPVLAGISALIYALFWLALRHPYRAAFSLALTFPLLALVYSHRLDLVLFSVLLALPIALRHIKDLSR